MSQFKTGRPSKKERAILSMQDEKETIRTSIILEKSFHDEVKKFAIDARMTVTELIKISVKEYMRK